MIETRRTITEPCRTITEPRRTISEPRFPKLILWVTTAFRPVFGLYQSHFSHKALVYGSRFRLQIKLSKFTYFFKNILVLELPAHISDKGSFDL
jgi:hypothetical protein